MLSYSFIC